MMNRVLAILAAAAGLLAALPAVAQEGEGRVIVTVLPKHESEMPPNVTQQDITQVKVNGKAVKVTSWRALRGDESSVELVLLFDGSARSSLGRQSSEIEKFVRSLPPNVKSAIAYMDNGRAAFAGPLSADREQVLKGVHLPSGTPGSNGSPYFCLSDLAQRWPSQDREARREVLMVTDGVDNFERRLDPDDPYVQAAMKDAARARLVVYSIYWRNQGAFDNTNAADNTGQSLLTEVTQSTGGKNFWQGTGNPVSFQPFFDELTRRLRNQYELGFVAPVGSKPQLETFKLKLSVAGADVDAPQQVFVTPAGGAPK